MIENWETKLAETQAACDEADAATRGAAEAAGRLADAMNAVSDDMDVIRAAIGGNQ